MRIRLVLAVCLAMVIGIAPAQAAPLVQEHYSGEFSDDFSECGLDIHVEGTFEGVFMLKEGRRDDPTPYYFDNYEVHETFSSNGKWFTIDHQGLFKDFQITNVEGTVYEFVAIEAGRPFVVRDMNGDVFIHDRGVLFVTFQVDTKGDDDLSNDEFLENSFGVLRDAGAHPGFYIDFCADLIVPLLG